MTEDKVVLGKRNQDGEVVNPSTTPGKQQNLLTSFVKPKDGNALAALFKKKNGKHPKSLWKDETLHPRQLENESIFEIIMPWVKEQQDEQKAAEKKQSKGGGGKNKQTTLNFGKKTVAEATTTTEETKEEQEELELLSKVVKTGAVEEFQFEYMDQRKQGAARDIKVRDIQCILINPKWADHSYCDFSSQSEATPDNSQTSAGAKKKKKKNAQTEFFENQKKKAFQGLNIEDFKKLIIPDCVMKDGMLFIWTEKELIMDIVVHFESQGFQYVENMVYVMLDENMKKSVDSFKNTDATAAIVREKYRYFSKSHKTLLMLRRTKFGTTPSFRKQDIIANVRAPTEKPNPLELRHQRTGDVVFDWVDPCNPFKKPSYYTYKLIETLLPKAMNKMPTKNCPPAQAEEARRLKMVELWAPDAEPRKGWLKVVSLR